MSTVQSELLDFEELFQLALRAMKTGDDEKAIHLLKRALTQNPNSGKACYLLGAMHAQIGLYDRAVVDLARAVVLDSTLDAAHFQLGLLHLTSGRAAEAETAWKALDKLADDHYLYLFKSGMLALARDDFEQCVTLLEKGITENRQNPSLNSDMERILEKTRPMVESGKVAPLQSAGDVKKEKITGRKVILTAYQNDNDETKH